MAKDGTNRGGTRPGAGRKKKPLSEKIKEGKTAKVMKLPEPPELENISMPPIKDFMKDDQRMGVLHADEIYTETWEWLKERNCAHLINPILLHEYAMATARWIQIEGVSSQFGFVNRHPTTGLPTQSPFVVEAQSYLKLSNSLFLCADHEQRAGVGQVAFVAKERVDGKLILPEAVQVLKMKGTAAQG